VRRAVVDAEAGEEETAVIDASEDTETEDTFDDADIEIPDSMPSLPKAVIVRDLAKEVESRRTFAIISHPDAGKTTLTEKLLYYGGAINEAGAVRSRRGAKAATSDWMEMEQQRGISISSTALSFAYGGFTLNLLDTPGHADFSEDTYRTVTAADNAVMLIDAAKGLEPQTRKLFEVCRLNGLPIFTFCNKMDRPSLEPLELLDQIEKEFNLPTYAVNWPIGSGDSFCGVYHRPTREVHLFDKEASAGKTRKGEDKNTKGLEVVKLDDPRLEGLLGAELCAHLKDDIELLDELGSDLDLRKVHDGELTPVFFGSGMNNFGVKLFLDTFLGYSTSPRARKTRDGSLLSPTDQAFTGFVFKLQANMDPRHRDKVAFVRVVSGRFERGMKVTNARTKKSVALSRPSQLFGQDKTVLDEGYAGDVIGLNNPGSFAIGDTLYVGTRRSLPPIPTFTPELFAYLRNSDTSKYKQFQKGITELLGEGAVQVMYSRDAIKREPILAAVGELQFEVVQARMKGEYGVETTLENLPFAVARWVVGGWNAVDKAGRIFNAQCVKDQWGQPVLLFKNRWNVDQLSADTPEIGPLSPISVPPSAE
jgi:peptide chain release factor 3